jgi:hypothetical protein
MRFTLIAYCDGAELVSFDFGTMNEAVACLNNANKAGRRITHWELRESGKILKRYMGNDPAIDDPTVTPRMSLFNPGLKFEMGEIMPLKFMFDGRETHVKLGQYPNKRLAIFLTDRSGMATGVLTCNLPGERLGDGEFFVKTWSENEELAKTAMNSGLFVDTGRRVPTGFVEAQVWKLKGEGTKDAVDSSSDFRPI